DVGQEAHLHAEPSLSGAGLAAAAGDVEGEAAGVVAAQPRVRDLGEEPADVVEAADVGRRGGARRAADGRLVDLDRPRQVLHALEGRVRAAASHREPERAAHAPVEHVVDERRLAGAGDARDAGPGPEGKAHVDATEVVLGRRAYREPRGAFEGTAR